MKLRIVWSVLGILCVTFVVAGFAHAQTRALPPITEVGDAGTSELEFQTELQVAAKDSTTTVAAVIGTQTGTAAEIAAKASTEAAVTAETMELKADVPAATESAAIESAAPVAKAESEIPVKLDEKIVAKTQDASLRDLVLVFAVLAGFGVLAYLFISKFKYRNRKAQQFEMKIMAQHHLGPKKSLAVVRVAGESLLIGVTDHHISMIKSLALLDEDEAGAEPQDFRAGLESIFSREAKPAVSSARETQNREVAGGTAKISFRMDESPAESEDFTISKIRDVVSKQIRNMKSLE
ncbi:MAG: flagellar biosynthetic protein FliO [Bdellovibrionaceae bacterium]|nr:flagellar biosynthetic protein FliO [Pseudobdellovibrionaceae bacterium]